MLRKGRETIVDLGAGVHIDAELELNGGVSHGPNRRPHHFPGRFRSVSQSIAGQPCDLNHSNRRMGLAASRHIWTLRGLFCVSVAAPARARKPPVLGERNESLNTSRLATIRFVGALLFVTVGCGTDEGAPAPAGSFVLPLLGVGSSGTEYKLNPARVRAETWDPTNEAVVPPAAGGIRTTRDGGGAEALTIEGPPGDYLITLLNDYQVFIVNEDGSESPVNREDVTELFPNPQVVTFVEGVVQTVNFVFGIGPGFVSFGNGGAEFVPEFRDEGPTTCPCWNATEGLSADCGARPCESIEDVWLSLAPATCTLDRCEDGVVSAGFRRWQAECVSDESISTVVEEEVGALGVRCVVNADASPLLVQLLSVPERNACIADLQRFWAGASFSPAGSGAEAQPCGLPNPTP